MQRVRSKLKQQNKRMSNKQKANEACNEVAIKGLRELKIWIEGELDSPSVNYETMCELVARAYLIKSNARNAWRANL